MNKQVRLDEYLRRNQLHCAAVGANANTKAAIDRLLKLSKQPQWLVDLLIGIMERTDRVEKEMAKHRDELSPYKGKKV